MKPLRVKRDTPTVPVLVCAAIQAVLQLALCRPDGFVLGQNSLREGSVSLVRCECRGLQPGVE